MWDLYINSSECGISIANLSRWAFKLKSAIPTFCVKARSTKNFRFWLITKSQKNQEILKQKADMHGLMYFSRTIIVWQIIWSDNIFNIEINEIFAIHLIARANAKIWRSKHFDLMKRLCLNHRMSLVKGSLLKCDPVFLEIIFGIFKFSISLIFLLQLI